MSHDKRRGMWRQLFAAPTTKYNLGMMMILVVVTVIMMTLMVVMVYDNEYNKKLNWTQKALFKNTFS